MDATRWSLLLSCPLSLGLLLASACDINVTDGGDDAADTDGGDGNDDGDDGNGNDDGDDGDDGDGNDDDDDDDDDDGNGNDDGNDDDGDGNDGNDGDDDDADETGADDDGGGAAGDPQEGSWLYAETGNTTSDCDFLGPNPSNGWGEYLVTATGSGEWQIQPSDGTDPFECQTNDDAFNCDERLQDEISQGSSSIQVRVSIDGKLDGSAAMSGTQNGTAVCSGPDCALAEQLLETSFPCTFSIDFTGTKT